MIALDSPRAEISYDYLIIDAHNFLHRNWWTRRDLKTSQGVYSGLEFGFLSGLLSLVKRYPEAQVVLVWDGEPARCRTLFPEYKLQRQPLKERALEPDWGPRIAVLREALFPLVLSVYHPEVEADDEIARLVFTPEAETKNILIFSNDKDLHQLVGDRVYLCNFEKNEDGDYFVYDGVSIQSHWGFPPERIPLYRSLLGEGDKSDGISGIPRLFRLVAKELVSQCTTIDSLLEIMARGGNDSFSLSQKKKLLDPANQAIVRRNYEIMNLSGQRGQAPDYLSQNGGRFYYEILLLCYRLELASLASREEWGILKSKPFLKRLI
jgi:DNA polymerase-1